MIDDLKVGRLERAIITGVGHAGLSVTTADGRPATLAVLDEDGRVIESGPHVAREAFAVSVNVHRNVWAGKGWLRVMTEPPGPLRTGQRGEAKTATAVQPKRSEARA